jgi:hypothetical protein
MRIVTITFLFLLLACAREEENKKIDFRDRLNSKIVTDENSFEQFLFLGRCRCEDYLANEPVIYHDATLTKAMARLALMNNPFVHLVNGDSLIDFYDRYIDSVYSVKLKRFKDKDLEKGNYDSSLEVVCADIFQDNLTSRKKYLIFMTDLKNFTFKEKIIEYVEGNSNLKSSEDW